MFEGKCERLDVRVLPVSAVRVVILINTLIFLPFLLVVIPFHGRTTYLPLPRAKHHFRIHT